MDNTGTSRTAPFVSVMSLVFNGNLQLDPDAFYLVFFSEDFGTASALLVNDNSGTPVAGDIGGDAVVQFDFDYDGNNQGGRTPGTDAEITVVAQGLGTAQYVVATETITRSTSGTVSLVSALERNYENAV